MSPLDKARAALARACVAAGGAAVHEKHMRQWKRSEGGKRQHRAAADKLSRALRRVCIAANDYQAERGRDF